MPSKTVMSIGQCRPDNAAITHFLTSNFDVEVLATNLADDSLAALQSNAVDLILINRKLDADYSDGMEIMKLIRSNPQMEQIPVMLVSNFPESQEQAVAAGATYGFGKAELSSPETVQRVLDALGLG
ncbi:MAG: response regulator transcription factor [Fuerstiella sp.]|nr:response regulator transcription factor [Fuerstiella sp.]MCP4853891.1 response regulator transcription factor [Fuerstiella sp.]